MNSSVLSIVPHFALQSCDSGHSEPRFAFSSLARGLKCVRENSAAAPRLENISHFTGFQLPISLIRRGVHPVSEVGSASGCALMVESCGMLNCRHEQTAGATTMR